MLSYNRIIGGILLVSGTTIGAAMLALPPVTGLAGFYPSLILFVIYWILLTFTAFLMLEVTLWMEDNTNLISMARTTLGPWGEGISWASYLFLLYSLTTAYLAGSSRIFLDFIQATTGYQLPLWFGPVPLLLIFGFFVYQGARFVDYANRLLMLCLVTAYGAMTFLLAPHVETSLLQYVNWKYLLISSSIIASSFGFHIIIPSLSTYLHRDIKSLKIVIIIGSLIPLGIYILWEWLALGILPIEGTYGIIQGYQHDSDGTYLLAHYLSNPWISTAARLFSFFAIITSFLGVSLSLRDFLADGFKIRKDKSGRTKLYIMTFLPTLLIMWSNPRAFLTALEYAGAFGVMILLSIMPALMVWRGRYKKKMPSMYQAPGGKLALIIVITISTLVVLLEIANKLGFAQSIIISL